MAITASSLKMPPMRKLLLAVPIFLFCFTLRAQADTETVSQASADSAPLTSYQTYVKRLDQKFDRGAVNFVAGWTEIIRQPSLYYQKAEKHRALKAVQGVGKGFWNGLFDTVGGFANALTSVFPGWEFPLPDGGIRAEQLTGANAEASLTDEEYKVTGPDNNPQSRDAN